jgi:hypothetical protein
VKFCCLHTTREGKPPKYIGRIWQQSLRGLDRHVVVLLGFASLLNMCLYVSGEGGEGVGMPLPGFWIKREEERGDSALFFLRLCWGRC